MAERDPGFAAGERPCSAILDELQALYLLRLDHALQAVYAVQRRSGSDRLRASVLAESLAAVRELDAAHLHRVSQVRLEFYAELQPHNRPVIAEHRAEVAEVLDGATALVVAGGHVGVLADVLHLFNVAAAVRSPVIAWSAGAMALAERIVLFHDRSAHGPGHPEVYGSGLSIVRDMVPLPHARARLLLDDAPRMAVFARRFAPARCVLLDNGTRLDIDNGMSSWPPGTRVLAERRPGHRPGGSLTTAGGQAAVRSKLAINRLRERRPLEPAVVDRFLARYQVPIVEGTRCTFLFRGAADRSTWSTRSSGCPAASRCAGWPAPTCGTSCSNCPTGPGSSTSSRCRGTGAPNASTTR